MIAYTIAMPMLLNSSLSSGYQGRLGDVCGDVSPVMVLSSVFYCGFGLGIAWLGIGSIRARRWSWKLLVAVGWLWVGLVGLGAVSYGFILPQMMDGMEAGLPSSAGGPSGSFLVIAMIIGVVIGFMVYITPESRSSLSIVCAMSGSPASGATRPRVGPTRCRFRSSCFGCFSW